MLPNVFATFSEGLDGEGVVAFGEAVAVFVADQLVVEILGFGEFEEGL